jgi:hypothetical protein
MKPLNSISRAFFCSYSLDYEIYFDQPFFGQLFLADISWIFGYPDSLGSSSGLHSIETLFVVSTINDGAACNN